MTRLRSVSSRIGFCSLALRLFVRIRVEGRAEPGAFITLLDGGIFTVTLEHPTGGDGRWAGEYLLHGGVNRIVAIAHDTTGIPSPPSNEVRVTHVVHPPLYGVGSEPATVAAGDATRLWAHVRGHWPTEGAATTAAWAFPPVGEPLSLSHRTVISDGRLWLWDNSWRVPAGLPSQDTTVYFEAVDGDNLSGWGGGWSAKGAKGRERREAQYCLSRLSFPFALS